MHRDLYVVYKLHTYTKRYFLLCFYKFFFLCLYSPILGLGRSTKKNFRFISVSRSMTVGRTPWTSDQLVARPLLTVPGDCDDGEVGGMNGFGRGNRSHLPDPGANPSRRGENPATNRFSYGAAILLQIKLNNSAMNII
jgi:hypothetical protein